VSKTAIVGVGNILMGDEGIGIRVIQALERAPLPENVTLVDGGTAFQALTAELAVFDKLIIVDAVNGGAAPGTIYVYQLEEILEGRRQARKSASRGSNGSADMASLHDIGVVEALMLERLVGASRNAPSVADGEVVIVGIEPARVELSVELSPLLEAKLPELLQTVLRELERTPSLPRGASAADAHAAYEEESS
jgi:hydrogenase maturation protease